MRDCLWYYDKKKKHLTDKGRLEIRSLIGKL
jgi:hypothetical protein